MKQVPNRKRLRRHYLVSKIRTVAIFALSYSIMLLLVACVLLISGWCFTGPWNLGAIPTSFLYFMPLLLLMPVSCLGIYALQWSTDLLQKAEEMDKGNPYVPPVTLDTLPADEVLVRGSEEPPMLQSKMLLRAVKEQETAKEELLRGTLWE